MTEAEVAGIMGWRGPGAYTRHAMRKVLKVVAEAQQQERAECAALCRSAAMQWRTGQHAAASAQGAESCADLIMARGIA